jgi:agmatinase
LPTIPGYLPESHSAIAEGAAAVFASEATPIFLGGDHSISLPLLRAAAARYGPVALVHFDSHSDLWHGYFGGKDTHGTPFRRALEEGLIDVPRSSQIGLRGSLYDKGDLQMSYDAGFHVVTGPELHTQGIPETIEQILSRVGDGPAYLTFDIDFVDPAYAPGTGTPEVGGFTGAQCVQLIRSLAGVNFVGFDLVEVMPSYDPAGVTSLLAANLVYEFISLIALQRRRRPASR